MAETEGHQRARYRLLELPSGARAEVWLERLGDKVEQHVSFAAADSSSSGTSNWDRCSQLECLGETLTPGGTCFQHADAATRKAYFHTLIASGRTLSLRGQTVTQRIWDEIVASPVFNNGNPTLPITLAGAEINAQIRLDGRTLNHSLELTGAFVFAHIELRQCLVRGGLSARYAFFNGGALNCSGSTFEGDLDISYSRAERVSYGFQRCTFHRALTADGIDGAIDLDNSTCQGDASFKYCRATLILNGCKLHGALDIAHAECVGLHGAQLVAHAVNRIGPCSVRFLYLPRATFETRVHIDVASDQVDLSAAILKEGGLLTVDTAKVALTQVSLGGPLRVSGRTEGAAQPEIGGLLNADAGQMSFARVNLTRCSFYSAHGLGSIDIESTATFPRSPWWAGRRRFIADEFAWRTQAGKLHNFGWSLDGIHVGSELPKPKKGEPQKVLVPALNVSQVAAVYRDLRRSLESKSDMPGAADFYYGEMEMRRWGAQRGLFERGLVWGYWLLSGYGLRAHRALFWWLMLVAIAAYFMTSGGFAFDEPSLERALVFSVRASLPGVSTVEKLTLLGQWIEIALRVFGPLMIVLFLLSVRSLVMRKPSE